MNRINTNKAQNLAAASYSQRGFSLVELVVALLLISLAVTGLLTTMRFAHRDTAAPLWSLQASAIADAYMQEIIAKSYYDPDDGLICPPAELNRADYDNVCDFNGLNDNGAVDRTGAAIAGLENYQVQVSIDQAATLHTRSGSAQVLRIDIQVISELHEHVTSAYRTARDDVEGLLDPFVPGDGDDDDGPLGGDGGLLGGGGLL